MIHKNSDGTNSWEVEIFRVGIWNGDKYVKEDLQEIVNNFTRFKDDIKVPLKIGHDMEQNLVGQTDGEPAIGWVSKLHLEGNTLVGTFSNVPDIVVGLIESKAYKNVSSEILFGAKDGTERVGKILVGVALLGADIPAVSGLGELGAMLLTLEMKDVNLTQSSLRQYSIDNMKIIDSGEEPMTDEEKKELEDLRKAKFTLEGKLEDEKKEQEKLRDSVRIQLFNNNKLEFLTKVNDLVKEGKVAPVVRDKLEKEIDGQLENYTDKLTFDESTILEMLSEGKIKVNKKETATQDEGEDENDDTPDVIVMNKAKALIQEKKASNLQDGMRQVLSKNKPLAEELTLYKKSPAKYQEMKGA